MQTKIKEQEEAQAEARAAKNRKKRKNQKLRKKQQAQETIDSELQQMKTESSLGHNEEDSDKKKRETSKSPGKNNQSGGETPDKDPEFEESLKQFVHRLNQVNFNGVGGSQTKLIPNISNDWLQNIRSKQNQQKLSKSKSPVKSQRNHMPILTFSSQV